MDDTSILNLLGQRVVDTLAENMQELVPDNTALGLVRQGKLQDDPTIHKLNILVRQGGNEWPHILKPREYNLNAWQYDLTGATTWLRRFVAEYTLFFIGSVSREEATTRANVIFSRFQYQIMKLLVTDLSDSFGESALLTQVNRLDTFDEGGPTSFIWRGTHYFEFLTEYTFD